MDPEFGSQVTIASTSNGDASKNKRMENGKYVVASIIFVGNLIGNIVTTAIGVHMISHCYKVAVVVMILGAVLGLLQQVPEFFRNFIKLRTETMTYVNYFFGLAVAIRIIWLIIATVVIAKSECRGITPAWICIYVNWGTFGATLIIIAIVRIVEFYKKRRRA
ncbi:hypothetical protein Bhyg_08858 [Pseudolycoriella hygida]|uniref:Uncharacterized protein n=1 Tax=Pseudolycoriella hygida TaxID=35572 RepID=A0A9Q0N5E3_9DIPT|nr:hypothetical protein Bhyg_08858 [Pseudolycoriella hygida]